MGGLVRGHWNLKPDAGPAEALGAPLASRVYEAAVRAAKNAIAAAEREATSAIGEATGSIVERAVWGAMMSVASAAAILVATTQPAGRGMVQGSVSGRPDITYDWNQEGLIAYHVLIDGKWRTLGAFQDASGNVRDANGNVLATVSHGPGSALSLTSDAAAIDRAAAALPVDASQASSGLDQIYVDPSTGRTLVVPAGTDPATLPPGFVPVGSDGNADGSNPEAAGGSGDNPVNTAPPSNNSPANPPNDPSNGASAGKAGLVDPALINQLIASGVKITPANVVATGVTPGGQIVWLETGDLYSGLQHIITDHAVEFANMGVAEADIPQVVMDAVTHGNVVGYQGLGYGRAIFQTTVNGRTHNMAVTIGSNGYVVGANPRGSVP